MSAHEMLEPPVHRLVPRVVGVGLAGLLGLLLVACGEDSPADPGAPAAGVPGDQASDQASDQGAGDNGRVFGSTDDAVITAVVSATRADRAEWDGQTLVVHFVEGSAEAPTAPINCSAAEIVIADDESARLVYPDGEIDCSQR